MKKRLLGFYDYTVILTYCGTVAAVFGIIFAIRERFFDSVMMILVSGICDMFDGTVARTKDRNDQEKRFGIQIDSMSDLISFGVLPGVFTYQYLHHTVPAAFLATMIVMCALIRLSYFNVTEEDRQREESGERECFLGLPVTTMAVVMPLIYALCEYLHFDLTFFIFAAMGLTAACFLIRFRLKKPKLIGKIALIIIGAFELAALLIIGGADLL